MLSLFWGGITGTGERLTQRKMTTRKVESPDGDKEVANRRVFYDFTFSPPKSVSILALVQQDEGIVRAHDRAIAVACQELETFAGTRVRKGGQMDGHVASARRSRIILLSLAGSERNASTWLPHINGGWIEPDPPPTCGRRQSGKPLPAASSCGAPCLRSSQILFR